MGFPVLKDVGCMSLKTGCLIIGIMGIISSVLALFALLIMFAFGAFLATIISRSQTQDSVYADVWDSLNDGSGNSELSWDSTSLDIQIQDSKRRTDELLKNAATVWIISMIVYAIISFGTMISSSCLVHGVRKGSPSLLNPFLIWAPFVIILWLILIIVPSVMLNTFIATNITPFIIWIGVVGFFWVIVYSHKKELSNPNYQNTDYARAGNTEGTVHYNVQQPGVQYNVPPQGVQYNVQQPGVQYNMPPQGVQYNMPPQGVQYNVPPQGVHYNAPPQGVQYKA